MTDEMEPATDFRERYQTRDAITAQAIPGGTGGFEMSLRGCAQERERVLTIADISDTCIDAEKDARKDADAEVDDLRSALCRATTKRNAEKREARHQRLLAMFWERTQKGGPDECWLWCGGRDNKGYGDLELPSMDERWRAHRLSYTLLVGAIPNGLIVMHSCDNPPCVNPSHLSVGTIGDNHRDMMQKGRQNPHNAKKTHCHKGHEFTPENTYVKPTGERQCRACRREVQRGKHD